LTTNQLLYLKQGIIEENRKENMPISSTPSLKGITSPQMWDRSGSFALGTSLTPTTLDRSNLRPLAKSYKGPQADYEVIHDSNPNFPIVRPAAMT